jgi:hypothetical protein
MRAGRERRAQRAGTQYAKRRTRYQIKGTTMTFTVSAGPLVALIAGILILIIPRLLNYIIALYLIIIGILGLSGYARADAVPLAPARHTSAVSGPAACAPRPPPCAGFRAEIAGGLETLARTPNPAAAPRLL